MSHGTGTAVQVHPTRLLDRLMWRLDEDGEWQHRLACEWDGNGSGRTLWSSDWSPTRYTELTAGLTWSQWGLGPSVEFGHEREWVRELARSVPLRRTFVGFALGPFYVSLHLVRPRKYDPDVPASSNGGSDATS